MYFTKYKIGDENEGSQIFRKHEHDRRKRCQPCIGQTMTQTWLSWFLLPCNGNCCCYTMENEEEQSAMGSQICSLWRTLAQANCIAVCMCLQKKAKEIKLRTVAYLPWTIQFKHCRQGCPNMPVGPRFLNSSSRIYGNGLFQIRAL